MYIMYTISCADLKWYAKFAPKLVQIGAWHKIGACAKLVHGALHQNCADLKLKHL